MRSSDLADDLRFWPPARTDRGDVLCRGVLKSGVLCVRFAVRRGPAGLTVSYPNRRGKALAWPDDQDRRYVDQAIIAQARREGWVA